MRGSLRLRDRKQYFTLTVRHRQGGGWSSHAPTYHNYHLIAEHYTSGPLALMVTFVERLVSLRRRASSPDHARWSRRSALVVRRHALRSVPAERSGQSWTASVAREWKLADLGGSSQGGARCLAMAPDLPRLHGWQAVEVGYAADACTTSHAHRGCGCAGRQTTVARSRRYTTSRGRGARFSAKCVASRIGNWMARRPGRSIDVAGSRCGGRLIQPAHGQHLCDLVCSARLLLQCKLTGSRCKQRQHVWRKFHASGIPCGTKKAGRSPIIPPPAGIRHGFTDPCLILGPHRRFNLAIRRLDQVFLYRIAILNT